MSPAEGPPRGPGRARWMVALAAAVAIAALVVFLALNPHIDRVVGAARDGHYYIEARIDDRPVRFLVNTGASDVILRPRDARGLGYYLTRLSFTCPFETAGGPVRGAAVGLGRFTISGLDFGEVNAWVSNEPMSHSLLGMSFLARLEAYEFRDDTLTLRP